ncbi:GNAT family N-acetyltransferase [Agromyces sp. NPDC004153]
MARADSDGAEFTIRPLGPETWDAYAALIERHNGVWGGCWCTYFHTMPEEKTYSADDNRALKQRLVAEGRAHAALVFDGEEAIAWCQYGPPAELPNIYHRKEYDAGVVEPPDYRLTCFFVDKRHRRSGVAAAALRGALELIAEAGGGVVEAYPHDTQGKKTSASFLYSVTRSMFEQEGFRFDRPKGKSNTVMVKTVAPARSRRSAPAPR